jgi:glutamate synthase domain-containing protein 2/glutamate synthase domain-containing protein 1/glutamate synthase domain-containing protein 3
MVNHHTRTSSRSRWSAGGFGRPIGLYDPANEHDSCGVGFIANLNAEPSHDLVEKAVRILINLEHRGAVGGDNATGDGAGILLRLPDAFLRQNWSRPGHYGLPSEGDYGAGMVFLPSDPDLAARCQRTVESVSAQEGVQVLGWRDVPVNDSSLGYLAKSTQPVFRQVLVFRGAVAAAAFERKLYVVRRLIEKEVATWTDVDASQFYIASLSSRTLIYKGMLTGAQLLEFFPDLTHPDMSSCFAIVHQRYSTNTLPTWSLAQPFRFLAHNGEINTLRGNINRMRAREARLESELFGDDVAKLKPILVEGGSDSAVADNMLELLVQGGRSLPHAAMMMVPEAWGSKFTISQDRRAFYEYHSAIMEPWDGPAALVFTDGRYIGATLDRNGLRPARYSVSRDGTVVLASETGVLEEEPSNLLYRGRLQPGRMLLVDLDQHRIVPDHEIKSRVSRQRPYRHWVADNRIELRGLLAPAEIAPEDPGVLLQKQHVFGFSEEELNMVVGPMAARGQEAVGSMGNDVPLAVLSNRPQLLFSYFKQLFAQVTNPAIDPLREELVMSLMSFVGRERGLLCESPQHCRMLKLHHPVLTPEDVARLRRSTHPDLRAHEIPILFRAGGDGRALEQALEQVFEAAERAIEKGATILLLTDRGVDPTHAPIPSLLAVSGLHHHLIRAGLRTEAGLLVETGEAREVIHFAQLLGYGANGICPYVAFSTIRGLAEERRLESPCTPEEATDNYINAVKKGLLKTFSRMGISTIRSFTGAQIFEAVGLRSDLVDTYFAGTASRVEGIGLDEIAAEVMARHSQAFPRFGTAPKLLDIGGQYHWRRDGERHLWSPDAIFHLHQAVRNGDFDEYRKYAACIDDQSRQHMTLRSLLRFTEGEAVPLDEVEPVEAITCRFVSGAMSFGSISREAHETLAIGMNRVGARSNSGEGGEDPARYIKAANGDDRCSYIKQVASGRFGVTIEYLVNCNELQIKVAQGAKPGEGGQLPGHKVSEEIARVRHTMPGVTLISPPPHHDIYSIEDLAQLIYDLKCANPEARVSVKLVSEVGVGTIAAGVAKAEADMVLVSGYDGGTGASPLTAIKHAGLPWELGLAETQQTLRANGLRDKIRVQTDGQLRTGRDLAVAALMGAEEFGFATVMLVSMGCVMMRKCHLNTCPVGVATQDSRLRSCFKGRPEHVANFLRFIAQDLREWMARLGFRTVDEMVGRIERLEFDRALDHWKSRGLDFSRLLQDLEQGPEGVDFPRRCLRTDWRRPARSFDDALLDRLAPALDRGEKVTLELGVRNVDRTVAARLSGRIASVHGLKGLPEDTITLNFSGSAGQSFGAFLAPGVSLRVEGDANDYVGKGMSGGRIVVVPPRDAALVPGDSVIVGNVVLYGATAGEAYFLGLAGERFCIRNSGATAVVEGVGDHGCEYMTGGVVVVLGTTGNNFAAGMSGGIAYVYDESGLFDTRCNLDMVDLETVHAAEDRERLRHLLQRHVMFTGSERAQHILEQWDTHLPYFVKVMPIDYREALSRMRERVHREDETVSATEEV